MKTKIGEACTIFYNHKEETAPINKTPNKCPKKNIMSKKRVTTTKMNMYPNLRSTRLGNWRSQKRWTTTKILKIRGDMRPKALIWVEDGLKHSK